MSDEIKKEIENEKDEIDLYFDKIESRIKSLEDRIIGKSETETKTEIPQDSDKNAEDLKKENEKKELSKLKKIKDSIKKRIL